MPLVKRISTLVLILALSTTLLAGCQPRDTGSDSSSSKSSSSSSSSQDAGPAQLISSITPDFLEEIEVMYGENSDTVGWLQVPGTSIDDVVVQKPDDKTNKYYLRKDFNQEYYFNGVYFADFRAIFGDGSREQLGTNTCIYGHAITDIVEDDRYSIKFGPLHDFRNEEHAKETPYIFFSTPKENLAFEVFAVFVANADNTGAAYNSNPAEPGEFYKMVKEEILPRSKYNYDVEINENDKFLTLSTCIYTLDNGTATNYPNTYYRYAIMAKLVDADAPLKKEAAFTLNDNVLIDPDGKWPKAAA